MDLYKLGSRGEMVRQIQKALAGAGYKVIADGVYGKITEEAVMQYQYDNQMNIDGVVGPATLARLLKCRFKKSKRKITEIIIHCTATQEGKDFTVADVRRWHKQQGWSDIGYHFLIGRHGEVWEGRKVDTIGAHCCGHNSNSIGVCYVGGLSSFNGKPKDTRTLAQRTALIQLLTELKKIYPEAKIYGHHDFDKGKDCPCFDARLEYSRI